MTDTRNKYASEEAKRLYKSMDDKVNQLIVQNNGQQKDIDYIKDTSCRIETKVDGFLSSLTLKADKVELKHIEDELNTMKDKREERSYDWLKYSVTTAIGVGTTLFVAFLISRL